MNTRIFPILALFIAIGIFFGYVNPTWSGSIAATKVAIALDNQALDAAAMYTKQQDALATTRAAIDSENLVRLEAFLPDSVDNVRLILDLNALAARSGLSLSNIDVTANDTSGTGAKTAAQGAMPVVATSPIGSVDLSLSALGTFTALQTFLRGVERSARLLDVKDIIVKGSDTGVYTYQMILRLYWLR
jgi:hypothetical protein